MGINKNLSILLSGQLISQIGDKFYLLALSYWILESTGSATMMGVVLFCTIFPETVISLVAGAFVDRFNRKWIIVGTDFFRGLIVLTLGVLFYFDSLNLVVILLAQVLLSVNAAFFNPAIPAVIPQIVREDQLSKANSQTQLIRGISMIAGPVLGGLSVAVFGYLFVFLFNAASFLISSFFELFLKLPSPGESQSKTTLIEDIKEGYRFILVDRQLIALIATIAVIHFFVGAIHTITPVFASQLAGNGAKNLGFLQTSFGMGMVMVSLVFGFVKGMENRERKILFASIFMVGLVNMIISFFYYLGLNKATYHLIPFFCYGGFIILAVTSFRTLIQKSIPNRMAGRVFGVTFSAGDVSIPLAMLLFGFLLDRFSMIALLAVSGICLMIFCLVVIGQTRKKSAVEAGEVVA
ncbi:MFS transporter [bacterium]|nr:MFS transporter [bacterium]